MPYGFTSANALPAQNDVPTIVGMNADEGSAAPSQDAAHASRRELSLAELDRDAARRATTSKQNLYLYYFQHAMPWPEHPEIGAFHSSELPYVPGPPIAAATICWS